jgi:hypothetical protein
MAANGFINLFKKRTASALDDRTSRDVLGQIPEVEQRFVDDIMEIVKSENPELVLNCDETSWQLYRNGILTWADTWSQNVAISATENEKDSLTVMATVSLARQKLPLYIMAKGETIRCEAMQLGDLGENGSDHSSSRWLTADKTIRYLGWLRESLDDRHGMRRIDHILMDIYPAHITESVRLQARLLGFNVYVMPSGLTDKYRPLDRSLFGCMKSTAR